MLNRTPFATKRDCTERRSHLAGGEAEVVRSRGRHCHSKLLWKGADVGTYRGRVVPRRHVDPNVKEKSGNRVRKGNGTSKVNGDVQNYDSKIQRKPNLVEIRDRASSSFQHKRLDQKKHL